MDLRLRSFLLKLKHQAVHSLATGRHVPLSSIEGKLGLLLHLLAAGTLDFFNLLDVLEMGLKAVPLNFAELLLNRIPLLLTGFIRLVHPCLQGPLLLLQVCLVLAFISFVFALLQHH